MPGLCHLVLFWTWGHGEKCKKEKRKKHDMLVALRKCLIYLGVDQWWPFDETPFRTLFYLSVSLRGESRSAFEMANCTRWFWVAIC